MAAYWSVQGASSLAAQGSVRDGWIHRARGEVASLVADGFSNEEISAQLGVSGNTVRYHLKELYSRIGKSSRTTLAKEFLDGAIRPSRSHSKKR